MGAVRLELVRGDDHGGRGPSGDASTDTGVPQRVRLADAALTCISRQGIARTTLEDVARAAGCSRATVYRVFPGGKDGLLRAVVDTEVARFFSALALRMGSATNLEDVLVAGMNEAAVRITGHPGLSFLRQHEPDVLLPHLAFSHMDNVLAVASAFTAPFLARWLDPEESRRVAEWGTRIVLSYLSCPADGIDLTDVDTVRWLVGAFVVPGGELNALRPGPSTASIGPARSTSSRLPARSTRSVKGEVP